MSNPSCDSKPIWVHTALRIKDPKVSVPFYVKHFGMTLLEIQHVPHAKQSRYYLARLRDGVPVPATKEITEDTDTPRFSLFKESCVVLLHDHGSEADDTFKVNNGNVEPHRGFGHIAFNTNDVTLVSEKLEEAGVKFQKRPNEGRMKGLAFALDPDGYWIEICGRGSAAPDFPEEYNLSQTMIRVKDPKKSVPFYSEVLGMTVARDMVMSDFSNYFLASLSEPKKVDGKEAQRDFVHSLWQPCLELTHNHGTEDKQDFQYHTGNTDPKGFCNLGFSVPSADALASILSSVEKVGGAVESKSGDYAVLRDPDNYMVIVGVAQ